MNHRNVIFFLSLNEKELKRVSCRDAKGKEGMHTRTDMES